MAQVEFQYEGINTIIECQEDQKISEIFNNFISKSDIKENEINFFYDEKNLTQIDKNLTFNQIANSVDKERKKMDIKVISTKEELEKKLIKSKNIICPQCGEDIKMKINNYKINLFGCKNDHIINNISLDEFEKTQMVNLNEIKCGICKKNKSNTDDNKLYKCNECNMNICPVCKLKHDKNHNIIDYDKIYYICNKHEEPFTNYCKKCKINICSLCEKEHTNHEMILLRNLIIENKYILNKIDEIGKSINLFNDNIDKIIEILNNMKNNVNIFYKLIENMGNNYNEKERNYQILNNINEIINNHIITDISNINKEKDFKIKFNNIFDIYNKRNINEINLKIKINKNDVNKKIYFLDNSEGKISVGIKYNEDGKPDFIKEEHHHDFLKELNESNVELYINDKYYNFQKYFIPDKEGEYNILLKFNILIRDCSFMFYGCSNLINIDLSSFNTRNATKMSYMFAGCSNAMNIDLTSFNTENVTNMSFMFGGCFNSTNLNLSSFDTKNVTNMSYMFDGCFNLKRINLSSFNTKNVINMFGMFNRCSKLKYIDLSSFNTQNLIDIPGIFTECSNLLYVDISSLNTQNVVNMSGMFNRCSNLIYADLTSFNTQNVIKMSMMFSECSNLSYLDLSSFNIENVTDMSNMFNGCNFLRKIKVNKKLNEKIKNEIKKNKLKIELV